MLMSVYATQSALHCLCVADVVGSGGGVAFDLRVCVIRTAWLRGVTGYFVLPFLRENDFLLLCQSSQRIFRLVHKRVSFMSNRVGRFCPPIF